MKSIISVLIFLFLPLVLFGQIKDSIDLIYLKNGSIFKGKVLIQGEGAVRFQLRENGSILNINPENIKNIKKNISLDHFQTTIDDIKKIKPNNFKTKGFYQSLAISLMTGFPEDDVDGIKNGFGFRFVYGYRFNRWIAAGLGTGMNQYLITDNDKIIPVFANFHGFINAKRISPMYNLDVGLGLGLYDSNFLENIIPGFLFHPSIGFRLGSSESANTTIDMGVRFQNITDIFFVEDFTGNYIKEEINRFSRITIRLGILF